MLKVTRKFASSRGTLQQFAAQRFGYRFTSSNVPPTENWRDDNESDNVPKVRRRDGSTGAIDKSRGFIHYDRIPEPYRDPLERVFDWKEINYSEAQHDQVQQTVQAARCMDCGTPFCQTHTGCPVNNLIPEWNELVFQVCRFSVFVFYAA